MARWAIIDKNTKKVLNVIEAETDFIETLKNSKIVVVKEGIVKTPDELYFVQSNIISVDDIIVDGIKIYRIAGELDKPFE